MKTENIETFFPELYHSAIEIYGQMTPVAYAIIATGLIIKVWQGSMGDYSAMLRAIMIGGIIGILVPVFPDLANEFQKFAYHFVDLIGSDPAVAGERYAMLLAGSSIQGGEEVGFFEIMFDFENGGIGEAIKYAILSATGEFASGIQYILMILQQVTILYGIAASPAFLAFFMLPVMQGVASRYFITLVSISFFPMGWALSSVLTNALLDMSLREQIHSEAGDVVVLSNTQGFFLMVVLTLWILVSTIAAPLIIHLMLTRGVNAGQALLQSFGNALSQGVSYGGGAYITARLAGASSLSAGIGGAVSGMAGLASGAANSSNLLLPSAIGVGAAMLDGRASDEDQSAENGQSGSSYTQKARNIYGDK